ncbi:MAG: cohesin domain-containing protein [Planctomycetia bacterium]|nr:cohesin domain-containing protein [Planctomycetia bacterium]
MYLRQTRLGSIFPVILCLWTAAPLHAAQFHVTTGGTGATAGSTVTVPIVVTAEVTVGAAQWELLYDPARLRWVGGDAGHLASGTLIDANLLEPGRAKIAFAGGEDVKGTGEIYRADFEWIGNQTEPTGIRFANVRAWDQAGGFELATSAAPGNAVPMIAAPEKPDIANDTAAPPSASPDKYRYVYIAAFALLFVAAMAALLRKSSKH